MKKIDKYDKFNQPQISKVKSKNVPQELKQINQWVCWRWVWKGNKWTKPPCNIHGQIIDHHQSDHSFKEVLKAHKKSDGSLGIGISMRKGDPICGIDIDPGPDGKIPKALKKAVKACGSYSEISPSGNGYRIFGLGSVPTHGSKKGSYVESYCHGRYLTVTGDANGAAGTPLTDLSDIAPWFIKEFGGNGSEANSDGPGDKPDESFTDGGILAVKETDYKEMLEAIDPSDYETWSTVGMALHHEYKGSMEGFQIWDRWSRSADNYGGLEDQEKRWKSFGNYKGDPATGLKIRYLFEKSGGVVDYDEPKLVPFESEEFSLETQDQLRMDLFPPDIQEAVREVARYIKTTESLIMTSVLGIYSAALAKRASVLERGGNHLQCSLGFFQGIPTGGRKSSIDSLLLSPFRKFEAAERRAWRNARGKIEGKIKAMKDQISFLRKAIRAGAEGDELEDLIEEIAELEQKIIETDKPQPRFVCSDITEEELSNLMEDNYETMFVTSDEGRNIIKNIIGRYSSQEAMSLYLHGLTGSNYKRDRVTAKKPVELENPCINMLVKVQKDALLDLVSDDRFGEAGMAARLFLSVYDVDIAAQYEIQNDLDLDYKRLEKYTESLIKLLNSCHGLNSDFSRRFGRVQFYPGDDCKELYVAYSQKYANYLRARKGKGLEEITNKMVSRSLILAAVMETMWNPDKFIKKLEKSREKGSVIVYEISAECYKRACEICDILTNQTVKVIHHAQAESEGKEAQRIVNAVLKDVIQDGKFGGVEGSFPGSIVSQKMAKNRRDEWREFLDMITGAGYFVEIPGSYGKYKLNSKLISKFNGE